MNFSRYIDVAHVHIIIYPNLYIKWSEITSDALASHNFIHESKNQTADFSTRVLSR